MSFYSREITENKGAVYEMDHAGFKASLMKAQRLVGEGTHGLPPGDRIPIYPIAALPGSPESWVREAGTYVCPVDSDWGLWFDWTMNNNLNTAVLPSVKGMNPITGQKLDGFGMQMYADKCPIHDTPFAHGCLCEKCGYEWPPQNYVSHPNTLWFDGFRQPDGSVRQFFFTDEDERDIASAIIGKQNTVPAFGFAFYQSKNPRTPPSIVTRSYPQMKVGGNSVYAYYSQPTTDNFLTGSSVKFAMSESTFNLCDSVSADSVSVDELHPSNWEITGQGIKTQSSISSGAMSKGKSSSGYCKSRDVHMGTPLKRGLDTKKFSKISGKKSKSVSVGGGAKIDQVLERDSLGLDGWKDEPSAIIRLYFCFEQQFRQIVDTGGVRELKSAPEGYLQGLPLG